MRKNAKNKTTTKNRALKCALITALIITILNICVNASYYSVDNISTIRIYGYNGTNNRWENATLNKTDDNLKASWANTDIYTITNMRINMSIPTTTINNLVITARLRMNNMTQRTNPNTLLYHTDWVTTNIMASQQTEINGSVQNTYMDISIKINDINVTTSNLILILQMNAASAYEATFENFTIIINSEYYETYIKNEQAIEEYEENQNAIDSYYEEFENDNHVSEAIEKFREYITNGQLYITRFYQVITEESTAGIITVMITISLCVIILSLIINGRA